MSKNRNMTVSEIKEKLDSGVWSADTPILEGKEALIYDRQLNRRISVNVISEAMDPVNKKALKKDFDDRKDKDIDNDGDTDDSDEYLHKRRKAISKAMKEVDLEEETVYVKRRYKSLGANQAANDVGFAKKISNAASKLGLSVKMNDKNFVISGDPEKLTTLKKTVKGVTFSMKEDEDLEEGKKWKSMVQWEDDAKKLGYTVKKQGGYGPIWVAFDHKNNRVAGKYNLEDPSTATLQEEAVIEKASVMSAVDLYLVYEFIKRLSTPFEETEAYKLGIINDEGKVIKSPRTSEEKNALTPFDKLIFNLKKLLKKVTGIERRISTFAAALFLLREYEEPTTS
jgi:hypothetical protein